MQGSGFEVRGASFLDKKKVKYEYEREAIKYTIPESVHSYTPDFFLPNGVILEFKGRWTAPDRKKIALVLQQHPELDLRLVFMSDNTLTKRGKTRYSDWCEKRGIKYHVSKDGSIPKEWYSSKKKQTTRI